MADAAIFIGWGQTVRGREAKALAVFAESVAYWTRLQQEGVIESFEPVILQAHGGDLAGFALLRGDREKLNALKNTDEFARSTIRGALIVDRLGVIDASIGGSLQTGIATLASQLGELT